MSRRFGALVAVAALGLAGCGGTSASVSSSSGSPSSSSTSSTTSPSETSSSPTSSSETSTSSTSSSSSDTSSSDTSAASSSPIPSGYKATTAAATKITFGVPSSWVEIKPATTDQATLEKELAPVAQNLGASAATMASTLKSQMDLYLYQPNTSASQFQESLNVNKSSYPASAGLPSKSALDSAMSKIGATNEGYSQPSTPLGQGVEYDYSIKARNGKTGHAAALYVPNGVDGFSVVTVGSGSAARTKTLSSTILSTLAKSN